MMRDLSKKNDAEGYVHSFAERVIPLDGRPPTEAAENLRKAKAARERLHKVAGSIKSAKSGGGTSSRVGVSGGASSQLLSSHAGAANPESLAAAFVSSFKAAAETAAGGSGGRIPGGAPGSGAVRKRTVAISGRPSAAAAAAGGPTASSSNSSNGGKSEGRKRTVTDMVQDAKEAAMDPSLYYIHARRHGCTKDVRQMFLATRADVPESEVVLHKLMIPGPACSYRGTPNRIANCSRYADLPTPHHASLTYEEKQRGTSAPMCWWEQPIDFEAAAEAARMAATATTNDED
mmetsp:Transcript_3209/g.7327  ORF Transcript_3209/g.7327 Transcript_3209/m.7327 type:complete len:290 (+) Transcript_3209:1132-2001(+)